MRPRFLTGDMVEVEPLSAGVFQPGMVVAVKQANDVPDAKVRGLSNLQAWSYYVLFPDSYPNPKRRGIQGPFVSAEVHGVR